MDKLGTSSSSTYTRSHHASISFTPDKKTEPTLPQRNSVVFVLHRCYICNTEAGTTKACRRCRREVCLGHALGSAEAYCIECEPSVKAEISREEYQKCLVKVHQELSFIFTEVEQRRLERDGIAEACSKQEEEVKGKTGLIGFRETELKAQLDQSSERNAALQRQMEQLKKAYDTAISHEASSRLQAEEALKLKSELVNQLDVINQEREIAADRLHRTILFTKETVDLNKLYLNACPECKASIESNFAMLPTTVDFKKFSVVKEQQRKAEKRDLCRCVTM
jgi:hypothetical protein